MVSTSTLYLFKCCLNHFIQPVIDKHLCPAVRTGFLHLAEALAYHRDTEVPVRAIIAMLKSGDRCNAEAELIGKGINGVTVWM